MFANVYAAKQALLNAISAAKAKADLSNLDPNAKLGQFKIADCGLSVAGGFVESFTAGSNTWQGWSQFAAARIDLGSGTPRYVIRITLNTGIEYGMVLVAGWRPNSAWSALDPYVLDHNTDANGRNYFHVGLRSGTTWVDPNASTWGFRWQMLSLPDGPI